MGMGGRFDVDNLSPRAACAMARWQTRTRKRREIHLRPLFGSRHGFAVRGGDREHRLGHNARQPYSSVLVRVALTTAVLRRRPCNVDSSGACDWQRERARAPKHARCTSADWKWEIQIRAVDTVVVDRAGCGHGELRRTPFA